MPTSLQQLRQNMNQSLNLQTTAPYLALAVELWDVFCENGGEYWPCYKDTALYEDLRR